VQGHGNSKQHLSYFSDGKVNISRHALVTVKNPMSIWKSNTPQQATGYLTLAAFAKCRRKEFLHLAHCLRK